MKKFWIKYTYGYKNDPLHFQTTKEEVLTKREILKLKRSFRVKKDFYYSIESLDGEKVPLSFSEKVNNFTNKIIKRFQRKKTIDEMQLEKIRIDNYWKKYKWVYIIISAIVVSIIGYLINLLIKPK